ncbi:MAG: hypothetical protein JJ953_08550 [Gracilimonas sp.]|uniref:hypothetical protein n=1 Tax=Gracilimonas sp. TaxID=1974203 RepID=UPI001B213DA0|nr:hypothetical protein [Gracilimonas sp.]MBO6586137.1 hypothetical protein [Gracilimonas sp.]MBO6614794.1 hypothetical protein [Gracilimonas sp.]
MKNFKIIFHPIFLAVLLFSAACSTNNSDKSPTIDINFTTNTSTSGLSKASTQNLANSLTFSTGTITLTQIQFEVESDENDSVEVNIEQIVEIDFATGETTPDLSSLELPVGTFVESRVELELLDENDNPSVVIEGTFEDSNGESHPIRFEFNSGETFEVEREGTVTFDSGMNVIAQVTFDPIVWFADVSVGMLEDATKNNAGVIVISETSNSDIFDTVADGLDLATEVEIQL